MRKVLVLALLVLLFAGVSSTQINYDERLAGERLDPFSEFNVQCELDHYTAPWGSVLEGDPEVIAFGTLSGGGDVLRLHIKLLANDDGYAPQDNEFDIRTFVWEDSIGSYMSVVNDGSESLPFQSITIKDGIVTWRVGTLEWNAGGYPWWKIGDKQLQEWTIKEQVLEPWRWSDGRRVSP